MEINCINLMNLAPRCTAHSKRSGQLCKSPAKKGWTVCRMHGAGGGAPTLKNNGNFKHGGYTKRTKAAYAAVRALTRKCVETIDTIGR